MSVFISYSTKDSEFVDKLCENLIMKNIPIWRDKWEMKVGDSLVDKIQVALEKATFLLVVLSNNSIESNWCKRELNSGIIRELEENDVVVIPILKEDCRIPIFLREKLYANFTKNFESGFQELFRPLQKLVSEHIGREKTEDQITDYAVNWGIHPRDDNFYMNIDLVTMQKQYQRTILLTISITGNSHATRRHILNTNRGLPSLMKNTLILSLIEIPELLELVFRLKPDSTFFTNFTYKDSKSAIEFDINLRCLMMGIDSGSDVLVHFVNYYEILKSQIRQ